MVVNKIKQNTEQLTTEHELIQANLKKVNTRLNVLETDLNRNAIVAAGIKFAESEKLLDVTKKFVYSILTFDSYFDRFLPPKRKSGYEVQSE